MKKMGIEAIYRKPWLLKPHPGHKVYPYLLRGMEITRASQVWAADITYLPMAKGFCYLVAIVDDALSLSIHFPGQEVYGNLKGD